MNWFRIDGVLLTLQIALGTLAACSVEAQESSTRFTLTCNTEVTESIGALQQVGAKSTFTATYDLDAKRWIVLENAPEPVVAEWQDITGKVDQNSICPIDRTGPKGGSAKQCINRSTGAFLFHLVYPNGNEFTTRGACKKVAYRAGPENKF